MKIADIKFLFIKHKLPNVFTPTTVAQLTYISRKGLERELEKYLQMPGMQIVLYGNSGSGKTTLIMNTLNKWNISRIKTICTETTSFDQLLLDGFDRLEKYYIREKSAKRTNSYDDSISIKYFEIAANFKQTESSEVSTVKSRVVPIQLTPQRLAEFLGQKECVWIIEDFHKVRDEEKKKLAQVLKVFMDSSIDYPKVRIICLGAVGTARELIQCDKELSNRIAELFVPLMSSDELINITKKGFDLLNVNSSNQELNAKITHYSNSLASVCHQLCYDLCYNKNIKRTSFKRKELNDNDFKDAVKSYLNKASDTLIKQYEKACTISKCKALLKEINERNDDDFDPQVDSSGKELSEVKFIERAKILDVLLSPEYGELFRYNSYSKKYMFSSPFFRTFLRMKFAMENAEQEAKRTGKRYELYQIEKKEEMFMEYFQLMDQKIEWSAIIGNIIEPVDILSERTKQYLNKSYIKESNRIQKTKHQYYKRR